MTRPVPMANDLLNRIEQRLGRPRLISRPVDLTLEPTLRCNSNCIMCNRNFSRREDKKADGFLSWDVLEKVRPFFRFTRSVEFSGFGEPLLHPEFLPMLREIKKFAGFVYFYTNGILLSEGLGRGLVDAGADLISISIGGATRETYRRIRGVDSFDQVVANIRSISGYKIQKGVGKPILAFNVVIMNSLLPELREMVTLAHAIGVSRIALPNLVAQGEAMIPESVWGNREAALEEFRKTRDFARNLAVEFQAPELRGFSLRCRAFFKRMFITWDGLVLSCPLERFRVGDLREQKIGSIWNGDGLRKLRRRYLRQGPAALCPRCPCWDDRPESYLRPWPNSREFAEKVG